MGLFGLFATIFGLGAMAKDSLSDMWDDSKQLPKAQTENKSCYYVNGYRLRATQTGRDAYKEHDFNTGHEWLVDKGTKRRIVDLTNEYRINTTEKNKIEAHAKGIKFYQTAMFDLDASHASKGIYINDDYPGMYFVRSLGCNKRWETGGTYYVGELVSRPRAGYPEQKGIKSMSGNYDLYYADGTLDTDENRKKKFAEYYKQQAIQNNEKYYKCMADPKDSYSVYYREVETDQVVYYNVIQKYYTKGVLAENEVQIKPHHKETYIVYKVNEITGCPRYNLDGSEWVE